jgi:hypothetical protein
VLQVIAQRLSKLGTFKKAGAPGRLPAEVLIKRRKRGRNGEVSWEVVRARGHLDEVLEMCKGGCKLGECTDRSHELIVRCAQLRCVGRACSNGAAGTWTQCSRCARHACCNLLEACQVRDCCHLEP